VRRAAVRLGALAMCLLGLGACVPEPEEPRLARPNMIVVREFAAPLGAVVLDPSFGFSLYRGSAGVPPRERAAGVARSVSFAVADAVTERLREMGYDAVRSATITPEPGARALIVSGTFRQINEGYRRRVGSENANVIAEARIDYQGPGAAPQPLIALQLDARQLPATAGATPVSTRQGANVEAAGRRVAGEIIRVIAELARRNNWPGAPR